MKVELYSLHVVLRHRPTVRAGAIHGNLKDVRLVSKDVGRVEVGGLGRALRHHEVEKCRIDSMWDDGTLSVDLRRTLVPPCWKDLAILDDNLVHIRLDASGGIVDIKLCAVFGLSYGTHVVEVNLSNAIFLPSCTNARRVLDAAAGMKTRGAALAVNVDISLATVWGTTLASVSALVVHVESIGRFMKLYATRRPFEAAPLVRLTEDKGTHRDVPRSVFRGVMEHN
mmetsp:Transcript_12716/g.27294  ORF Transcript_12716/g.27294 Transcript_12716/m.27294 type:complete len:226 (-) Transcript_12716:153-830(-)